MRGSLAALGALYLLDNAKVFDIHMVADGQSYTVSEESKERDFKKILEVMGAAAEINLAVEYDYRSTTGWGMYELVGPFPMMNYMDGTEASELNDIFYTAWNSADCSDGPGILVAYGEHDGKIYHGIVEYTSAPEIPAGTWTNTDTVIYLEPDQFDEAILILYAILLTRLVHES